jgi:hypothetical protein
VKDKVPVHVTKACGRVEVALDGGKWQCSRPGRFTPCERARGLHGVEGLIFWRKELSPFPAGTPATSCRSSSQPVTCRPTIVIPTVLFRIRRWVLGKDADPR